MNDRTAPPRRVALRWRVGLLAALLASLPLGAQSSVSSAIAGADPASRSGASSGGLQASSPGRSALVQQGAKLTPAGEDAKRLFGYSVAVSEDASTILIGAPKDDEGIGAAWVFTRSGETWQQTELVGGEDAGPETTEKCGQEVQEEIEGCGFGRSVALSADGDTALIGSPRADGAAGVARVFTRAAGTTTWAETKTLTPPVLAPGGRFGKSVALSADGDTALVGAPAERDAAGAAWVFTRPSAESSAWSTGERLTGGEESSEAHFGLSVALSEDGTTALIGGPTDRGPTGPTATRTENAGAAWVFMRTSSGSSWAQEGPVLTGGTEELGEGHFGYSVALSAEGDTALVGARGDHEGTGAAWVYTRSPSDQWTQGPKLTPGGEPGKSAFGYSLALSADGDTALIGSPKLGEGTGRALVFTNSAPGWTEQEELAAQDEEGEGEFGASVALSADAQHIVVGGPIDDGGVGAAWSFAPGPGVTSVSPKEGPATGGTTVTIAGSGFGGADAVDFVQGKHEIEAASFTVNASGTSITAVSPEAKAGTVDVIVKTPAGTSIEGEADRFTYLAVHKRDGGPPTAPSGGGPSSGGPTGTGATAGANTGSTAIGAEDVVLGFGPFASPTCRVSLLSRRIAVKSHSRATLRLSWRGTPGVGTCAGKLTIKVKVKVKDKRGKVRSETRTIAVGSFSVAPGASRTVTVRLNAAGRALLGAGHGSLSAKLVILDVSPPPARAQSAIVHLAVVHLAVHKAHASKQAPRR
jgi:IPT/TIG domain-containing protein/FG-GAP repeat protein